MYMQQLKAKGHGIPVAVISRVRSSSDAAKAQERASGAYKMI